MENFIIEIDKFDAKYLEENVTKIKWQLASSMPQQNRNLVMPIFHAEKIYKSELLHSDLGWKYVLYFSRGIYANIGETTKKMTDEDYTYVLRSELFPVPNMGAGRPISMEASRINDTYMFFDDLKGGWQKLSMQK